MSEYADLIACYRSGQITEAAWQEHLKDEGLRAYVEGQRAVVRLDPRAHGPKIGASTPEPSIRDILILYYRPHFGEKAESYADRYLSAAVPADVAGLAREYRPSMPADVLHLWASDAATALTSMSAELAAVKRERDANHHLAVANGERAKEEHARAERAEAALAEARKALEPFAAVADTEDEVGRDDPDDDRVWVVQAHGCQIGDLTAEDFFAARRAHQGGE